MDWNHELLASLTWLVIAFAISSAGLSLAAVLLARRTPWGRQLYRLAWPYFKPSRGGWLPLAWLALIVFMTLFAVRINVLFSFWYNGFYSALQNLDQKAFWFFIIVFAVIAAVHVARSLLEFYLREAFQIRWRTWLTGLMLEHWFAHQAYYRSRYVQETADNPDQRIQQDVETFVASSVALSMGLLKAVVSLFSFTLILWGLSGVLMLFSFELPRAMVFLVYLYVIVATVFAVWIGRPLVLLNFMSEKLAANFRYALVRLREYGESIAFFHGESVERSTLLARFAAIISNRWQLIYRMLKFTGFNLSISQAAVIFPFIVQAQRFFSKQISLGDMMQTVEAFGQVQDALSFFRDSYDEFAKYRAMLDRLTGFLDAMEAAQHLPVAQIEDSDQQVVVEALNLRSPAQTILVDNLNMSLAAGTALLIRGRSGVGKTTLLRAIAGLWPYVDGKVTRPAGTQTLFLPQKPYLPLGTLRTALYYPLQAQPGERAAEVLRLCQLAHLIPRLDEEADWTGTLSLGEQQRLSIGRALLCKPQAVFLDEASSAMDEGLEHAMYQLLREHLPQSILVSVGHRSSLLAFHTHELELRGGGSWSMADLPQA